MQQTSRDVLVTEEEEGSSQRVDLQVVIEAVARPTIQHQRVRDAQARERAVDTLRRRDRDDVVGVAVHEKGWREVRHTGGKGVKKTTREHDQPGHPPMS